MRCPATRRRPVPPAATPTSPSRSARASCWRWSGSSCPSQSKIVHDPARILIVDDSDTNRDILETRLKVHGYDLIQAADGEEALAATKQHLPDLILLDVMMPKLDGFEVCRRLKADAALPFTPI